MRRWNQRVETALSKEGYMRKYKYFTTEEFDSPDEPGSGEYMEHELIERLDVVRDLCGFPLIITSGYRTIAHNKALKAKGYKVAKNSSHLLGLAADILVTDNRKRYVLLDAIIEAGFVRIGLGDNFIHVDIDGEKSQVVMWTY